MWSRSEPDEPTEYDTAEWLRAMRLYLMPTERMIASMYELAKSADRALGRGGR
jgi:hypothetical protein